jgi:hypothetical protein
MQSSLWRWPLIAALALLTACAAASKSADTSGFGPNNASMAPPPPPAPPPPGDYLTDGITNAQISEESTAEYVSVAPGSMSGGDEMRSTRREAPPTGGLAPPSPQAAAPAKPPPGSADKSKPTQGREGAEAGAGAAAIRQPMLIYTAGITMIVAEVKAALARIDDVTKDLGGFLSRRDDVSITIRVPVSRFDEAVRRIEALGQVVHRNVSVEDVTEEFVDLEVRLKNLRAIRARLESLLEKAKTVEESVLIERELGRVAGEIERIEGRMKLLKDRAAYSTITVSLQEKQREDLGKNAPRVPVGWLDQLGLSRLLSL